MKKSKQKLMKRRICLVARTATCASFFVLAIIGISSIVRAMSLETVENRDGVPATWKVASLEQPDTITLPITYWDQKADACGAENHQFEWATCGYWTHGVLPGIVKNHLGSDGLPIPAFSDSEESWKVNHDALTMNVTGHDPVLPTDNFYRWFHEVPGISRRIDGRTVTFTRTGDNSYTYGGQNIYPIDDVPGLDEADVKLKGVDGEYHNFNFTAHLNFAIKVRANGEELFEFSGDDDVWFFLNNRLVLDIGGLHGAINGRFRINKDGTLTTYVEKVNDLTVRDDSWTACMREKDYGDFPSCVGPYNTKIRENFKNVEVKTLDIGLEPGDVVNLDFFYAERSTDSSNTKITVTGMDWPISADCNLDGKIISTVGDNGGNLVQYDTSITNRDPNNVLDLKRLAAYISDSFTIKNEDGDEQSGTNSGYIPLDIKTLYYTKTPDDESSWQMVDISAPLNSLDGFTLSTPLRMSPNGQKGDTLYFRYFAETSNHSAGTITAVTSYYTELLGVSGITHDATQLDYTGRQDSGDITEPDNPEIPDEEPNNPEIPLPPSDIIDDGLVYLPPLGEIAFVPNTGIISEAMPLFEQYFANAILSQSFVLITLLIFSGSFATFFTLRKYLKPSASARSLKNVHQTLKSKSDTNRIVKNAKSKKKTTKSNQRSTHLKNKRSNKN